MHPRAARDLMSATKEERDRFAAVLEHLELHCTEAAGEKQTGAECMDRAFWLLLQLQGSEPTAEILQVYVSIIQSESMQSVDRYLKQPISPYKAEMRFYRRISEKRDRIVREMLLGRIPLDRLNRLKSMTEGEEAQKALAIYEGLEAVLSRSIE